MDIWDEIGCQGRFPKAAGKIAKNIAIQPSKKSNVGGKNSEMNPHSCHLRAILTTFRHTMHIIHIYIYIALDS